MSDTAAVDFDLDEQFAIFNPVTGGIGVCSGKQYIGLYAARGWERIEIPTDFILGSLSLTAPTPLNELERDQLVQLVNAWNAQKPSDKAIALDDKTVAELQAELAALGLPTGGKKAELIDRLVDHEAAAAEAAASDPVV